MKNYPKIAIVYLLYYHNEGFIDDVVSSLRNITYPKDKLELVIVDNPFKDEGNFSSYVHEAVMPLSGKEIPHVTYLPQETNTGFALGNNIGGQWAIDNGFDYVVFHNNDGFFASNAFEPMVEAYEIDKKVGIVQSLMMLHPDTDRINSSGNSFHYLGFGYCSDYRKRIDEVDLAKTMEIPYASGAAFMISTDLMKEFGMWDEDFFLYHEDMEWCFRLRSAGYKILLASHSIFYHKYQFARSIMKFYWMERNRYGVWLMYFRLPTLLVLFPMSLVMEFGLIFFAIKGGWLGKRMEVYKYWLKPSSWKLWLGKRRKVQKQRTVSDRHMLSYAADGIHFQDASVDNPLVNKIANPIMKVYYKLIVRGLIWW